MTSFNVFIFQYGGPFRWSHWPPGFLQVVPFQRQGTFVEEEGTLFRKQEAAIHSSCLSDIFLSHVCALLSVINTHLCDHTESKYASWHSTSNCMCMFFLRTCLRWAFFIFCVVLCLIHKWVSPDLWFFAYNLISCALLWVVNIRQEIQIGACRKYSYYLQFVLPKWQANVLQVGEKADTTLLERSYITFRKCSYGHKPLYPVQNNSRKSVLWTSSVRILQTPPKDGWIFVLISYMILVLFDS